MEENKINDLVLLSQTLGKNIAYVQGGGGNISVKLDSRRMAIKASGYLLKDVSSEDGYSIVDYTEIGSYLLSSDIDEDIFTKKIQSFVIETNNRPSIETGFHAQLGTFVVHTHSVYANFLTCAEEGKELANALFPKVLWIPYATPGRALTLLVQKSLKDFSRTPNIIFLQNHGIIVIGETSQEVLNLHEEVNITIQNHFNLSPVSYCNDQLERDINFIKSHILFPDQVVYTLADDDMLKTTAAKETLWAYNYIYTSIQNKGLNPHFLPQEESGILLNMESEKYRQKVLRK
jgi:ribulose-5-phosphate 4-epimerase/fuculose-1-phosphate aldolase